MRNSMFDVKEEDYDRLEETGRKSFGVNGKSTEKDINVNPFGQKNLQQNNGKKKNQDVEDFQYNFKKL